MIVLAFIFTILLCIGGLGAIFSIALNKSDKVLGLYITMLIGCGFVDFIILIIIVLKDFFATIR